MVLLGRLVATMATASLTVAVAAFTPNMYNACPGLAFISADRHQESTRLGDSSTLSKPAAKKAALHACDLDESCAGTDVFSSMLSTKSATSYWSDIYTNVNVLRHMVKGVTTDRYDSDFADEGTKSHRDGQLAQSNDNVVELIVTYVKR